MYVSLQDPTSTRLGITKYTRDVSTKSLDLLSLPAEILVMICTQPKLSRADLSAVRLVCKELHSVATKEFAQRYFQDPFVMMTKESLEALVDICKHPVFGPQVRKVQLFDVKYGVQGFEALYWNLRPTINGHGHRKTAINHLQSFLSIMAYEADFEESGVALQLFTKAFRAINVLAKPFTIATRGSNISYLPIGMSKLLANHDLEPQTVFSQTCLVPRLNLMLRAAEDSGCKVSAIQTGIRCSTYGGAVPAGAEILVFQALGESVLGDTEEFCFEFAIDRVENFYHNLDATLLVWLLNSLPKRFKTLRLSSDIDLRRHGGGLLRTDLLTNRLQALENVYLSKLCLFENLLWPFLKQNKDTMKKLSLESVHLVGSWDLLLLRVAKELSLDFFMLTGAAQASGASGYIRPERWYTQDCKLRGAKEVHLGLVEFCNTQQAEREARELEIRRQKQQALRHSARIAAQKGQ